LLTGAAPLDLLLSGQFAIATARTLLASQTDRLLHPAPFVDH
jgi:hypothetical protein